MKMALTAKRLWDGSGFLDRPLVIVDDGIVVALTTQDACEIPVESKRMEFPSATLAPAFLDVHIHGAAGHDAMEATPAAMAAMGGFLATRGTTSFLATTVTAPIDATLRALCDLARIIATPPQGKCARPLGIHLDGPFLSPAKRGVHPPSELAAPSITLFDRFYEAAEGQIKLMTLAPELPGAVELGAHATARGVRVSLGHSNATAAETRAAMAGGAVSATHTFNAMRPLDHREPGILGVVLTEEALFAEIICDGVHTAPEMVRLWWRAKGPERALLVTDAISATGMTDGEYMLGDFAVQVANGRAMAGGVLAGSVLTLDRALANFMAFTGATLEEGLPLVTRNPAAMTGLDAGSLRVGGAANLVALDAAGNLIASFVNGVVATRN